MTVRIVHAADLHIDTNTHARDIPGSTLNTAWTSNLRCGMAVADAAVDHQADAVVWAGDLFRDGRPNPQAITNARQVVSATARAGIPTVVIGGNHEDLGRTPGHCSAITLFGDIPNVHVAAAPGLLTIGHGIQIACMPWPSKTQILARLGLTDLEPAEGDIRVAGWVIEQFEEMAEAADPTSPLLLAGHFTVDDITIGLGRRGSEQDLTHVFHEAIIPRGLLEQLPYSYGALGHIHDRQRIGTLCYYAGSPNRFTETDAGKEKGANLLTLTDDNVLRQVDLIQTPARPMARVDLQNPDAADHISTLEPGTLVWVTLRPGENDMPPTIRAALRGAGAQLVRQRTVPAVAPRVARPTVAEGASHPEALATYLTGRGIPATTIEACLDYAERLGPAAQR